MTQPERPDWQPQGPASRCIIHGRKLGWLSCTANAVSRAIKKATFGRVNLSMCAVREETGDTVGGTTLPQCAAVAEAHGVEVEVRVGPNVAGRSYFAYQVQSGRGAVVQGNTSATIGTPHQSTAGGVNHALYVNEARGGTVGQPAEGLVYDGAADGRKRSYHVDQGPSWWPWARILAFAAALHPWGESDPRTLKNMGIAGIYAAFFPDTEPHVHLRFGAAKSTPFPDRTRVDRKKGQWAYLTPAYGVANRAGRLEDGDLFTAFQRVVKAGRSWSGDHDGVRWVPSANLSHVGGGT